MSEDFSYDYAIHSDFLIHWTGGRKGDFDCNVDWQIKRRSQTNEELTGKYLTRLKSILKYGFWMTEDEENTLKEIPQTCFTELKLSQARNHAKKYGRLGIGVKRLFALDRGGRPLVYFSKGTGGKVFDQLYQTCLTSIPNDPALNFFKKMHEGKGFDYRYFFESEWRIIGKHENKYFLDPKKAFPEYYATLSGREQQKLKFLMPVDKWLGIIIYPSLEVKREAFKDEEIRMLLDQRSNNNASPEQGIWPIELDLDACRNF